MPAPLRNIRAFNELGMGKSLDPAIVPMQTLWMAVDDLSQLEDSVRAQTPALVRALQATPARDRCLSVSGHCCLHELRRYAGAPDDRSRPWMDVSVTVRALRILGDALRAARCPVPLVWADCEADVPKRVAADVLRAALVDSGALDVLDDLRGPVRPRVAAWWVLDGDRRVLFGSDQELERCPGTVDRRTSVTPAYLAGPWGRYDPARGLKLNGTWNSAIDGINAATAAINAGYAVVPVLQGLRFRGPLDQDPQVPAIFDLDKDAWAPLYGRVQRIFLKALVALGVTDVILWSAAGCCGPDKNAITHPALAQAEQTGAGEYLRALDRFAAARRALTPLPGRIPPIALDTPRFRLNGTSFDHDRDLASAEFA